MRIGILGGSFNPAHDGHLYISREALKRLQLQQVWWLVSPQNPLKSETGMAPFAARFANAKKLAQSPGIKVSDIEQKFGTIYTYDTLRRLKAKFPEHQFVLIIGADNLAEFPKWRRWREIFNEVPIAVFDREGFFPKIIAGKAAGYFAKYRKSLNNFWKTPSKPGWIFFAIGKKDISATIIRAKT